MHWWVTVWRWKLSIIKLSTNIFHMIRSNLTLNRIFPSSIWFFECPNYLNALKGALLGEFLGTFKEEIFLFIGNYISGEVWWYKHWTVHTCSWQKLKQKYSQGTLNWQQTLLYYVKWMTLPLLCWMIHICLALWIK